MVRFGIEFSYTVPPCGAGKAPDSEVRDQGNTFHKLFAN